MKKILLLFFILFSMPLYAFAGTSEASEAVEAYIKAADTGLLQPGYINGEWLVLAAARSDVPLPDDWSDAYYTALCNTLTQSGGILNERKYTEYSRTVIALTAIGKDPRNVAGYDLLKKLEDTAAVKKQGVNGSIYALIALDCGAYDTDARQFYKAGILAAQNPDGGFALADADSDADMTAMALQALARYQNEDTVSQSIDKALAWLGSVQTENGGFKTAGSESCESAAQVLAALCELGIDPDTDERFIKNGSGVVENILSYRTGGGFKHLKSDSSANAMASEQAVYALVSYLRTAKGSTSLYTMKESGLEERIAAWAAEFRQKAAIYKAGGILNEETSA